MLSFMFIVRRTVEQGVRADIVCVNRPCSEDYLFFWFVRYHSSA